MTDLLATSGAAASAATPVIHDLRPGTTDLLTPPAAGTGSGGLRVLVAFASRHGATREIAAELARSLSASAAGRSGRLSVTLAPVEVQPDPARFDAVVLGSAVYSGRWLEPARRYVEAVSPELSRRPTWLFSSGLGQSRGCPGNDDRDALPFGQWIDARGHRTFPGRLERRLLSAAERSTWPAGGTAGDLRDWRAVRAWAEEIAVEVVHRHAVPVPG
ncbi:flavodoxin domain-containing protein [Blastococcus sp. SYSU DS0619]